MTTPTLNPEALERFATAMGVTREAAENLITAWGTTARLLQDDARTELRWRLNEQLQGRDPGKPFNWKGLDL